MLFGDLGTSRRYGLGLAFRCTQHASLIHIFFVTVLLVLVGGCYLIICRKYPDGGGVYSVARSSRCGLAVVGGGHGEIGGVRIDRICMLAAIGIIGAINWFGPRGMGRIALVVAVATVAFTAVVAICALPSLHHTRLELPVRDRSRVAASRFFNGDVIGRVAEQLPAAREMVVRA